MATTLPVDANAAAAQPQHNEHDPSKPSSDYQYMQHVWKMVSDILEGVEAMRATSNAAGRIGGPPIQVNNVPTQSFAQQRLAEAQSPYLPKFPNEPVEEYDRRRSNAFLTNIYSDISTNLSGKPFAKECELDDDSKKTFEDLSENIDGLGNNLHVFSKEVFKSAMDKGLTWILVDYTKMPPNATLDDERKMGARPYWVNIPVERLLAVYSKFLNGVEIIFHARIEENTTELDGYEEVVVNRVRVFNREPIIDEQGKVTGFHPAKWQLFEEDVKEDPTTKRKNVTWNVVDEGDVTIGFIPLVPVILGKREGTSWRVKPPLKDLAYMQVKLFQMENNLDCIKELTAFPMLAGDGISGEDKEGKKIKVPVGPRSVLFAPMNGAGRAGTWHFIEPSGSSLTFLQTDIDKYKTEMRDLGYQPLTTASLTVITTANISLKANSVLQSWALMLKDALEQAWKITCLWLKKDLQPVVNVHTDFDVDVDGASDMGELQSMEGAGVISKKTMFNEAKRRGKLSEDLDFDEDQEQIAAEQANNILAPEVHIDPVTGMPIAVNPQPGTLNPPPKPPIKVRPGERVIQ